MSHFNVAVIHKRNQSIEDLLAPYYEGLKVEPYIGFTKQEAIDHARKYYMGYKDKSDEECWDLIAEYHETDDDGNIYYTYNPNSKWDWYEVGGRWGGMLRLKDGKRADEARIGDIDFSIDEEDYQRALRFWDVIVDHKPKKKGEQLFSLYKDEYYKEYYGSREAYAKEMASFSTFAVVTPDGDWREKGAMGWFGISSETAEESKKWSASYADAFINSADPDLILTVVDCHI